MCGRAVVDHSPEDIAEWLGLGEVPDVPRRYNLAPTDPIPTMTRPGKLAMTRWGLAKGAGRGSGFNVRKESLGVPAYRSLARALVVVSGFYEWRAKQPFYIHRADGHPLVFAGLTDGTGAAIITAPPTGMMLGVHDRMPVIVERADFAAYLDPEARLRMFVDGASSEALTMHAVGASVGAVMIDGVANDGPGLIEPVSEGPRRGMQMGLF